jgi:hypothetical protein
LPAVYARLYYGRCSPPRSPFYRRHRHPLLPRTDAWGDQLFNYGAVPQTFEDPAKVHPLTGAGGDSDPIDIIELGGKQWQT